MTTRRGFLGSILALGAAPAIVQASSLMKLYVPPQELMPEPSSWAIITDAQWRTMQAARTDLSEQSLEDMMIKMQQYVNESKVPLVLKPTKIIIQHEWKRHIYTAMQQATDGIYD